MGKLRAAIAAAGLAASVYGSASNPKSKVDCRIAFGPNSLNPNVFLQNSCEQQVRRYRLLHGKARNMDEILAAQDKKRLESLQGKRKHKKRFVNRKRKQQLLNWVLLRQLKMRSRTQSCLEDSDIQTSFTLASPDASNGFTIFEGLVTAHFESTDDAYYYLTVSPVGIAEGTKPQKVVSGAKLVSVSARIGNDILETKGGQLGMRIMLPQTQTSDTMINVRLGLIGDLDPTSLYWYVCSTHTAVKAAFAVGPITSTAKTHTSPTTQPTTTTTTTTTIPPVDQCEYGGAHISATFGSYVKNTGNMVTSICVSADKDTTKFTFGNSDIGLTALVGHLFENNTQLEDIKIGRQASMTSLPDNLLANMEALTKFDAGYCRLTDITAGFFSDTKNLKTVLFPSNFGIRTLREGVFNGLQHLDTLQLTKAGLQTIEEGALDDLPKLKKLYLNGNSLITTIPSNLFAQAPNMRWIYLNDNGGLTTEELKKVEFLPMRLLRNLYVHDSPDEAGSLEFCEWLREEAVKVPDVFTANPGRCYHKWNGAKNYDSIEFTFTTASANWDAEVHLD